jgi:hypothetical protein
MKELDPEFTRRAVRAYRESEFRKLNEIAKSMGYDDYEHLKKSKETITNGAIPHRAPPKFKPLYGKRIRSPF